ncbi:hypothetical protein QJS04_geneDACA018747 [Acorus gramineus]|uniref:Uncharacterized protein n=1 Tax=Acorus gramineus TaxID=55184 RepID=A0AAV9AAZ0_ACOGR|nr:hypothetical protein QJS04_geneDACA018747 [Acorus gramineus]
MDLLLSMSIFTSNWPIVYSNSGSRATKLLTEEGGEKGKAMEKAAKRTVVKKLSSLRFAAEFDGLEFFETIVSR